MLTLEEITTLLQDRRIDKVAAGAGVHRNTVAKIRSGSFTNPSYDTIRKLSDYLKRGAE
jgi:transcriptional regulator with XRE-family HTH domain